MVETHKPAALDDWSIIERILPEGWQAQAKTLGAMRRARGVRDPSMLLRILLVHLADGCSLAETSARVTELGWCKLSAVAVLKRLRASDAWLNWLCRGLFTPRPGASAALRRRARIFDSTMVSETGQTGSMWRLHFSLTLADLRCDHFELTSSKIGESLSRFPARRGDLILGDRGLGRSAGIASVRRRGADVLVRINPLNVIFYDRAGRRQRLWTRLRSLRVGKPGEWSMHVRAEDGELFPGRLIAIKRSARAADAACRRARRKAQQHGKQATPKALRSASYFMIWTSVEAAALPASQALELYKERWQIELAFKRSKSILGLGQLPKHNDESSRAWLHGKLLVALLVDRLIKEAETFSPWGYPLQGTTQPVA